MAYSLSYLGYLIIPDIPDQLLPENMNDLASVTSYPLKTDGGARE